MARITKMDSKRTGKPLGSACFAIFVLAGFCFGQAVGSASAGRPATKGLADWNQLLRSNMQRFNPYEKVLNINNVRKLSVKWSYDTDNYVYSAPAVVNGVVYFGGPLHRYINSGLPSLGVSVPPSAQMKFYNSVTTSIA
jgi:hypothetical protein